MKTNILENMLEKTEDITEYEAYIILLKIILEKERCN